MCRKQPTEREARYMLRCLEVSLTNLRKGSVPDWGDDGVWFTDIKRGTAGYWRHGPIASDVSLRCHDCNKVIVIRHSGLVRWHCERNWQEKEDIATWYDPSKIIKLCVGCSNKRWPATKALMEWNDTRLAYNRVGRLVSKIKKEQANEQH
jgi:hypothetical protein